MDTEEKDIIPYIAVATFADSAIPNFSEVKGRDYIRYGDDNLYPQYLTDLFNKSAKHNAILIGKGKYIFGEGFLNGNFKINRLGESLNDVSTKLILDEVVYGGWYAEIIWNRLGKIQEVYHVDYTTVREDKNGGYLFCEQWKKWTKDEDIIHVDEFDPTHPVGSQIYCFRAYRPGQRYYPLPDYVGAINYIEVDIEIGKFNLSGIRNGMNPSKMIQFFKGEPTEDKKKEIEHRMGKKFAGAENAGKFLLVFNEGTDSRAVQVDNLSANDLDKMYDQLNKTCQQEIFSGHLITSPMLFGIKTEGQLGGTTELNISYSIFQNTYSKPKADVYSKEIEYLLSYSDFAGVYDLQPTDPIGLQFELKDVVDIIPIQFIQEKLGIPKNLWDLPNVGSVTQKTAPSVPGATSTAHDANLDTSVNQHLKHLNAKQLANINRVIRKYKKGEIEEAMAKALLRSGYGLSDDEVDEFLGIKPALKFASNESEDDRILSMFDSCGEERSDFDIVKRKPVNFSSDLEMEEDEEAFKSSFKDADLTPTEAKIIDLIKKDPLITPAVISVTIGQTLAYVESKLDSLVKRGYVTQNETVIGADVQIERAILPDLEVPPTTIDKVPATKIKIMYSYEVKPGVGPELIATSRPFCIRMIGLNRLYSRADIERISVRLGYSVFDRKGGFWGKRPECRHRWVSNVVIKKG